MDTMEERSIKAPPDMMEERSIKAPPDMMKGVRDRPGRVALSMGFDAARHVVDNIAVKQMTGREFADLVVALAYSFESVLTEKYR